MKKFNFNRNFHRGFTLIELLVVVGIIGLLASVVLAALTSAKTKGADAAVKSNLANSRAQAEIFYNTNTVVKDSYTNVCTNGIVGGATGVGAQVLAAAKAAGLASYGINNTPAASGTTATCNWVSGSWAAEVPLSGSTNLVPKMWCVDNTGKSQQEPASLGATTVCA